MSVFKDYSSYYDLLYKDKDYKSEVNYISNLINQHNSLATSILELGCGTGKHAVLLSKEHIEICGVDLSNEMLIEAQKKLADNPELKNKISFHQGDVRTFRIDKIFDVVLSLFHVISYQTSNEDIFNTFLTANKHLKQGGLLIFDVWYGPAVLTEKPESRIKYFEDEFLYVERRAEPILYPNDNIVDVNYNISIKNKNTGMIHELKETHKMRYLFKPELEFFLKKTGFQLIKTEEWLSGRPIDLETWGACFICKKISG